VGILECVHNGSHQRTRRFLLPGGWLQAGAVLSGLALLGVSAPANAQTLTWSVVPSPSRGVTSNLNGVSCVSATACTAVGGYADTGTGHSKTLTESWNGISWSVVPSPSPGADSHLNGVSCVSATVCTAVGEVAESGHGKTLTESWNGTSWSVVPSPSPGADSHLIGVSCVSASACTAVGYFQLATGGQRTLVESWNGTSWSRVPSPSREFNSDLSGVSCASATACTAVGSSTPLMSHFTTLVESWNGSSWSIVASPSPSRSHNVLGSVSCVSATACMAVGGDFAIRSRSTALAESWNGTSWSVVPSGSRAATSYLAGVSCVSATACTAVGYYIHNGIESTLIESWDGTSWSIETSRNRGVRSELDGVSCLSATACTATGYHFPGGTGHFRTLIESGTASG
jgi:hypothetical protein